MTRNYNVDPTAKIGEGVRIKGGVGIGRHVVIGSNVTIGEGSMILDDATIGNNCFFESGVTIGRKVKVGSGALILRGARVCPNPVVSESSDARKLEDDVSIGREVFLHDEVELANDAIVPSQRTIAALGNFGTKNRVVTVYGSHTGPLYSIGCQMGADYLEIRRHILEHVGTNELSAGTYAPFLGVFQEVGAIVQQAFDSQTTAVAELLAMRSELGI